MTSSAKAVTSGPCLSVLDRNRLARLDFRLKITAGPIFRAINKAGRFASHGFSPKVIWGVVKQASSACALAGVAHPRPSSHVRPLVP